MRHDSYISDSYTHTWDMTHIHIHESWLIYIYSKHDSYARLIYMRHDSYTWNSHTHKWDMTHVPIHESWLIYIHMRHDSYTRLIYMRHDSYESCLIWRSHVSYTWVMPHVKEPCLLVYMCVWKSAWCNDTQFTFESFNIIHLSHSISCDIRWQNPTGCFIFKGHFLQKSPIISGSFAEKTSNLRHPMCLRHPVCHVNHVI